MMKHIGKHDQRKAVLLFKEVPNEEDMCLIVYTDLLPRLVHDPMMKCLESDVGQNAHDITGPLSRTLMDDGRNVLNVIHSSGHIRKVPTNQMIITPNANTTIRLDELNKLMKEMSQGDDATKRMADIDAQAGMRDPAKEIKREPVVESTDGVLTDAGIAQDQLTQAQRMQEDAARLITEAENLTAAAYTLAPELKPKAAKKASVKATAKRGPGRPKNVAASKS
jgi:hypothetical protein